MVQPPRSRLVGEAEDAGLERPEIAELEEMAHAMRECEEE